MLSLTYLSSAKCEQAYDRTRQTSTEVQGTCIVRCPATRELLHRFALESESGPRQTSALRQLASPQMKSENEHW